MDHHPDALANKRPKLEPSSTVDSPAKPSYHNLLTSLNRPISPPPGSRSATPKSDAASASVDQNVAPDDIPHKRSNQKYSFVPSPVQLSKIRDLPPSANIDTVCLRDLICDPMIKELWLFDYLFDINFVMAALDEDVRTLVQIKIIHGFWRRDDRQKEALERDAARYPNVQLITAYMPEAFGTHHTKMMVMIRQDETAQVVIHTANMIDQDWANLTQAAWRSPLLPLLPISKQEETPATKSPEESHEPTQQAKRETEDGPSQGSSTTIDENTTTAADDEEKNMEASAPQEDLPIGSGRRFKADLIHYLDAYGNRLTGLTTQLTKHDFSSVRAALIASVPSRQTDDEADPGKRTSWGRRGLSEILQTIPCRCRTERSPPVLVAQVSSIATLGQTTAWLSAFHNHLARSANTGQPSMPQRQQQQQQQQQPELRIVFPTADEMRASLDGYSAGLSIHMKTQTAAQRLQLKYIAPLLHRWAGKAPLSPSPSPSPDSGPQNPGSEAQEGARVGEALRQRAAPHVKTYVRFSDQSLTRIDWALVTSANLSTQAWGAPARTRGPVGATQRLKGEVRVCSYELGVVVWPALFAHAAVAGGTGGGEWESEMGWEGNEAVMVPVFGKDMPNAADAEAVLDRATAAETDHSEEKKTVVVGFRMPYDLPLAPYSREDTPWSLASESNYTIPDWKGQVLSPLQTST